MNTTDRKTSTARLAEVNPAAMARYKEMRAAVLGAVDLDRKAAEVVITAQLALLGHEAPFKIHATRARELGVSKEQLQSLILACVGVTMIVCEAARALQWLDELSEDIADTGQHQLA